MVLLYLIAVAIQIAIAAVCYRIAVSKGRSGILWAIVGFLLPVIGLVVIFILPDTRRS
jgi:hypothetical protein